MNKKTMSGLIASCLLTFMATASQAVMVANDPIVASPASTDDLWAYSYDNYNNVISSAYFYQTSTFQYASASFQGYVTGNYGPWSATADSFSSGGGSDYKTTHVFETYILSSVDQTVRLSAGGDDGRSIFIDDVYRHGAGFSFTSFTDLIMTANTAYKITLVHNNYTGPWGAWFSLKGGDDPASGYAWGGSFSEGQNISMSATDDFTPSAIPEPTTMLLFGTGIAGLAAVGRRKRK